MFAVFHLGVPISHVIELACITITSHQGLEVLRVLDVGYLLALVEVLRVFVIGHLLALLDPHLKALRE